jgi:hypothetical protein
MRPEARPGVPGAQPGARPGGQQGRAMKGGGGRGEGKREGGGSSPRGSMIAATVHRITPRERRWKRGRGSGYSGKENERERRGGVHGGALGAGTGRVASQAKNPLHARPLIRIKSRIKNRNETDARSDTTSDKRNMLRHDATTMST